MGDGCYATKASDMRRDSYYATCLNEHTYHHTSLCMVQMSLDLGISALKWTTFVKKTAYAFTRRADALVRIWKLFASSHRHDLVTL